MYTRFFQALCGGALWLFAFVAQTQLTAETLYVCNQGIGTVSVVDVASGTIKTSIISPDPFQLIPTYIIVTPNETKAYVAYSDSDQISVIDLMSNSIMKTLTLQAAVRSSTGAAPLLALTPDGTKLYVVHSDDCSASVIDTSTDEELGFFSIGTEGTDTANAVAISPDGEAVYITRSSSNGGAVVMVSTKTNEIVWTIFLRGDFSIGPIAISPDGTKAYVGGSSDVIVVDLQSRSVTGSIEQGYEPSYITFRPGKGEAYAILRSGVTRVIDVVRNANIRTILTPSASQIAFSTNGKTAFMNDQHGHQVVVVDLKSGRALGKLPGYSYPLGLADVSISVPLSVSFQPPLTPVACRAKVQRVSPKKKLLTVFWKQSPSPEVIQYDIYFDNEKIASVDSTATLSFSTDVNASRLGHRYRSKRYLNQLLKKFSVRSVSSAGIESLPMYPKLAH